MFVAKLRRLVRRKGKFQKRAGRAGPVMAAGRAQAKGPSPGGKTAHHPAQKMIKRRPLVRHQIAWQCRRIPACLFRDAVTDRPPVIG